MELGQAKWTLDTLVIVRCAYQLASITNFVSDLVIKVGHALGKNICVAQNEPVHSSLQSSQETVILYTVKDHIRPNEVQTAIAMVERPTYTYGRKRKLIEFEMVEHLLSRNIEETKRKRKPQLDFIDCHPCPSE